jgi:hypothetical protein
MNSDSIKIELIDWIAQLNDQNILSELLTFKKKLSIENQSTRPIFGSGKHLVEYIADDFDEPLDLFKEYQR